MQIFKCLLAIAIVMIIFYRIGILIKIVLKRKNDDIFNIIVNGFIGTFAIFEIIALPFNLFNFSIQILFYIEIIILLIALAMSFILNKKSVRKEKFSFSALYKGIDKKQLIIAVPLIIIIALQMCLSSYLYTSNADDAFYVSMSEQAKEFEQFTQTEPSLGQEDSAFQKTYIFNSWETFIGFTARILNLDTATVAHTVCPVFLILIVYMSYYLLARKINKKHALLMLLILAWIFLFSGVSQRFRGYTLIVRIWQGKTILTNIFMPFILYNMLDLHLSKTKIALLIITNISSIAFNPIAMWLFPLIYFFFTVVMLFKKQIKNVFRMIIVILPNLILLPVYLKMAVGAEEGMVQAVNYVGYIEVLTDFVRNGWLFLVLYLLSVIYIAFKGSRKTRILFIFIPILVFLTVLNPLFVTIVQKYVTTSAVYWRLFWLIPIEITIAYAVMQIIVDIKEKHFKLIAIIVAFVVIAIVGKFSYSLEFQNHINSQKIPQYIIDETNFILNNSQGKVLVVAPPEPLHSATMRQLSSRIILLYSRQLYVDTMQNKEEKLEVYNKIYDGAETEEIYEAINKFNVDFIILDKSNREKMQDLDESIAKIVYEDGQCIIIRNNKLEASAEIE